MSATPATPATPANANKRKPYEKNGKKPYEKNGKKPYKKNNKSYEPNATVVAEIAALKATVRAQDATIAALQQALVNQMGGGSPVVAPQKARGPAVTSSTTPAPQTKKAWVTKANMCQVVPCTNADCANRHQPGAWMYAPVCPFGDACIHKDTCAKTGPNHKAYMGAP